MRRRRALDENLTLSVHFSTDQGPMAKPSTCSSVCSSE